MFGLWAKLIDNCSARRTIMGFSGAVGGRKSWWCDSIFTMGSGIDNLGGGFRSGIYRVPVIGDGLRRAEIGRMVRNYDLTTREGIDREYGLIETMTGMRFEQKPEVRFTGGIQGGGGTYEQKNNLVTLDYPGTNSFVARFVFWHESAHALVYQAGLENRLENGLGGTFGMMARALISEGLARYVAEGAMSELVPFLGDEDRKLFTNNRGYNIVREDASWWLGWAYGEQERIVDTRAQVDRTISLLPAKIGETEVSREGLGVLSGRVGLVKALLDLFGIQLRNFRNTGYRIGLSYVNGLAKRYGLKTAEEIVEKVVLEPPKNWRDVFTNFQSVV